MAQKKYNKAKMWRSFLESDYLDIMPWAREMGYQRKNRGDKVLTAVEKIVKGWAEKKKGIIDRSLSKLDEEFEKKLERDWKKTLKNASNAEMKIINDFAIKISQNKTPRNTQDYERVFKMFRLVLGKSTNNNQNSNANFDVSLTEEEKNEIAEVISRNNAFYNRPRLETIKPKENKNNSL